VGISQDKTGLLTAFLGSLPGHMAARLAMAVEVDRLMDGKALPHGDILTGLRPVLRRECRERTLTPLRLFCRPFQDLLTSESRKAKRKAAIARGSVMPVWQWVSENLLPDAAAAYVTEVRALILAHKLDAAQDRAAQFWLLASAAMTAALRETRKDAVKILGEETCADADEMALLLSAGPVIEKLQAMLPRPVPTLNEPLLWQVREVYDELVQSLPDVAPYVAVVMMHRLAKPWEALRLPLLVTRHSDDVLISKTDMGMVGEIVFARMDALKVSIQATRHPLFDAETLMEEVKSFSEMSSNIVREIEMKRDGEWGKRLLAERVQVGKVMETFMDRALKEFIGALPSQKSTGADFSRHPGAEKHEMALRYARLVAGSRNFAAAASFAAKQKTAYDDLCTALTRYNEDVVRELKSGNPARRDVAAAQYQLCTELTAILFSEEEAELLRRRGKAALAAAA
jgi:hypothetical protein